MKKITIALAGNANVGKSVIFNQLTRGAEITGNWPKKKKSWIYRGYTPFPPTQKRKSLPENTSRGKTRCLGA
jgi:50S ribosomal subunit-associated GTPase HflX